MPEKETDKVPEIVRSNTRDDIREKVIEVIAQRTGYPPEMLDADLDLEADLGIDSDKLTEIVAVVCQAYGLPVQEFIPLRGVRSLADLAEAFFARMPPALENGSGMASILDRPALRDVSDVVAAAKEVFGADGGLRWLGTPVPALKYATPISLADTPVGRQEIRNTLLSLAHGNW